MQRRDARGLDDFDELETQNFLKSVFYIYLISNKQPLNADLWSHRTLFGAVSKHKHAAQHAAQANSTYFTIPFGFLY